MVHVEADLKELKFPPYMVSVMPTAVSIGAPLEKMRDVGDFIECTELEKLDEEKMLLRSLNYKEGYFCGSHNYNLVPVNGLIKNKEVIIRHIDNEIANMEEDLQNSGLRRTNI